MQAGPTSHQSHVTSKRASLDWTSMNTERERTAPLQRVELLSPLPTEIPAATWQHEPSSNSAGSATYVGASSKRRPESAVVATYAEGNQMFCDIFGQEPGDQAVLPMRTQNLQQGSRYHFVGGCSPCVYWHSGWCRFGLECESCHFQHAGVKNRRKRLSKKARSRVKKVNAEEGHDGGSCSDSGDKSGNRSGNSSSQTTRRRTTSMSQVEANRLSYAVQDVFKDIPRGVPSYFVLSI